MGNFAEIINLAGPLLLSYGGTVGATKTAVDAIKMYIPISDEHKRWILPLLSIIIAGAINYAIKGGEGGIGDVIEGISLGLATSKVNDEMKKSTTLSTYTKEDELDPNLPN